MKRTLWIIRHGKSAWDIEGLSDHDRPLAPRGIRASCQIAELIKTSGKVPELLLSSSAMRALSTAQLMGTAWGLEEDMIEVRRRLYLPTESHIQDVLEELHRDVTSVAIFGHNPGFTDFANMFLKEPLENLPTAGVVRLEFEADSWTDLRRSRVKEEEVICPKRKKEA